MGTIHHNRFGARRPFYCGRTFGTKSKDGFLECHKFIQEGSCTKETSVCFVTNGIDFNRARVYTDVNETRGREYWDYKNFALQWGSTLGDYEVGKKLGRGKVSAYFC